MRFQLGLSASRVALLLAAIPAGFGAVSIGQAQAASGVGSAWSIKAQQGAAGSVGGVFKIGGGLGGTSGTNLGGDTQVDLGATVSNVSAKCSFLVGGSSILDITQSSNGVTRLNVPSNSTLALSTSQGNQSIILAIQGGTGTVSLQASSIVRLTANNTGLGLYAATPVAQAARVGQLTDSTGGTVSTTLAAIAAGAAYSQADMVAVKNAIASLASVHNAGELANHNLGVTA